MTGSQKGEPRRRRALALGATALFAVLAAAGATLAGAEFDQKGDVRVAVSGEMSPRTLPRSGAAPVSVSVSGRISPVGKAALPQLKKLTIEINRHGHLDFAGMPVCSLRQIQPATTAAALGACRGALVGEGTFSANVVLRGQPPYPSTGRLLVFNGREGSRRVLLGHIYTAQPFTNSFVIVFKVTAIHRGDYGTALVASLPSALGSWGYVTGIKMTLGRPYAPGFLSAGCPAPAGVRRVPFPLARTAFAFADGTKLSKALSRDCKARG